MYFFYLVPASIPEHRNDQSECLETSVSACGSDPVLELPPEFAQDPSQTGTSIWILQTMNTNRGDLLIGSSPRRSVGYTPCVMSGGAGVGS
jgi:hypothetical protein